MILSLHPGDQLVAPDTGDSYDVVDRRGSGAVGVVYACRINGSHVAIKIPADWSSLRDLMHEVRYTLGEQWPFGAVASSVILVQLTRRPEVGLVPAVVYPLGEETLYHRIIMSRRLAPKSVIRMATQISTCLSSSDLMHRDLKPENILLDRDGNVMVADWGLAVPQNPVVRDCHRIDIGGCAVGTACYMAPEQLLAAESADCRCDIFSLGIIMIESLVGSLPRPRRLAHQDQQGYLEVLLDTHVVVPSTIQPPLRDVISRMTSHPRARRTMDWWAVLDDLDRCAAEIV